MEISSIVTYHLSIKNSKIKETTINLYNEVGLLIEKGELRQAIESIIEYATLGNKYYDENEPWVKVKENIDEFNNITYTCVYIMANLSNLLNPFMPSSANKIKNMLNLDEYKWEEYNLKGNLKINNLLEWINK